MYFPAMSALRFNSAVESLGDRLRERGKEKMVIIGAAMRKLLHICYGVLGNVPRLKVIFADGGYEGVPQSLMGRCFHWGLHIVRREESQQGFAPLPKRWVVERTFGWFSGYRRLTRDYECRLEVSEAMIRLAMSHLMLRRIT
jgi:transposase